MQLNDFKCMPKIDQKGQFCPQLPGPPWYPKDCVCSAGTQECAEDPRRCPAHPLCNKTIDLVLVLDTSYSIGKANFSLETGGMQKIVDMLPVSDPKVHVGLVTFDYIFDIRTRLALTGDKGAVDSALSSMPYDGGATCIGAALDHTLHRVFAYGRPNAQKVMVFISDGNDDCNQLDYPSIATSVAAIHGAGIMAASVGVGGNYSVTTLSSIASTSDDVYLLNDYDVGKLAQKIVDLSICKHEEEPETLFV